MDVTIAGGSTYASPHGAAFYTPGAWCYDTPELSAPLYEKLFGSATGVDGQYSVDKGLRSQSFRLRVLYVNNTEAGLMGAWFNDSKNMAGPVDVSFGGITLKRCFCEPRSTVNTPIVSIINQAGNAVFTMYATILMDSKGE